MKFLLSVSAYAQAITSTRKGNKKLAIYDLKITMRWEAQAEDDEEQVGTTWWDLGCASWQLYSRLYNVLSAQSSRQHMVLSQQHTFKAAATVGANYSTKPTDRHWVPPCWMLPIINLHCVVYFVLLLLQYTGTLQLDDFASHSEPDEYVFTLTADAVGQPEKRELYKGVVQSLYPQIVETLQRVTKEMLEV